MKFLHKFNLEALNLVIQNGWQDLVNTDFYQLKFSETELALKVGAVLFLLILLKMIWILFGRWLGWENYSRKDSGHLISGRNDRYLFTRFILTIPTLALVLPLLAILFAIASPYLSTTKEEKKYIETRTRIEFRDVSGSMGFPFNIDDVNDTNRKSNAEIAAKAHLKFLEMRRGKNDRTAFWLFSNDPYPVQEDFIVDDELYYLKVYDAPWELGPEVGGWTDDQWNNYTIPKSRYLVVEGQGGTQLSKSLRAAIQLFDADAKKQKLSPYKANGRSILIISDADISDLETTKVDLENLNKRRIRIYIILIGGMSSRPQYDEEGNEIQTGTLSLLQEIINRGGKYFPISDESALEGAYQEIDKLEKTRVEIVTKSFKVPAFQKFIFLAIVALVIIIPLGLLVQLLRYP